MYYIAYFQSCFRAISLLLYNVCDILYINYTPHHVERLFFAVSHCNGQAGLGTMYMHTYVLYLNQMSIGFGTGFLMCLMVAPGCEGLNGACEL